jgi:hypothetical protein
MDAETTAAIAALEARLDAFEERLLRDVEWLAARVRWFAEQHNHEWRDAAAWRTQWSAELDAIIAELALLKAELHDARSQQDTRRRPDPDDR